MEHGCCCNDSPKWLCKGGLCALQIADISKPTRKLWFPSFQANPKLHRNYEAIIYFWVSSKANLTVKLRLLSKPTKSFKIVFVLHEKEHRIATNLILFHEVLLIWGSCFSRCRFAAVTILDKKMGDLSSTFLYLLVFLLIVLYPATTTKKDWAWRNGWR